MQRWQNKIPNEDKQFGHENNSSDATKTFDISINSDGIRGSLYGVLQIISASARDKEIIRRLDSVIQAYHQSIGIGNNIIQYAQVFDLQNEKLKLKAFLESDFMQENLKFWAMSVGVHDVGKDYRFPQNKVCIHFKYDPKGLPEYFKASFKNDFNNAYVEIDLINIAKELDIIKTNKLTYLENIQTLLESIRSTSVELQSKNNQERALLLSDFNSQWDGQLKMTYLINVEHSTGVCQVEDKNGRMIFNTTTSHIKIERGTQDIYPHILFIQDIPTLPTESKRSEGREKNQSSTIANTHMSFWKQYLPLAVVSALAVGVGMSTLLYSKKK